MAVTGTESMKIRENRTIQEPITSSAIPSGIYDLAINNTPDIYI
jgi:hypothetical protein